MRLVLLPGMDGVGDLFEPLVKALPDHLKAQIVRYPLDTQSGYEALADAVKRAIPRDEPYALVAESFSGPVAIMHAAERPANLHSLILCATFAANPLPWGMRWLRWLAWPACFMIRPPAVMVRWLLLDQSCQASLVTLVRSTIAQVSPLVLAQRVRLVLSADVRSRLPEIHAPTLYLAAARDRLIGGRGMDQLRDRLPGMRCVTIEGPHLLLQARPREAAAEIARFIASAERLQ